MVNLKKIFFKLKFRNPSKCDVVILHHNTFFLKKYVLKGIKSINIANDLDYKFGRIYFITPALALKFFLNLCLFCKVFKKRNYDLNSLLHKIYKIYLLTCIDQTKAKVVITYIDNSNVAQDLSVVDNKRTYFFVQNGVRTLYCVRDSLLKKYLPGSTVQMTNFFCFGQRDVDLFSKHRHKIGKYFPIGSLGVSCYKSKFTDKPLVKFDLCLISQWDESFFEKSSASKSIGIAISAVNILLAKFIKETNFNLVICPRNKNSKKEIDYFKGIFGNNVFISKVDYKNFLAYRLIDQSRLVIALNSTLLLEALSWGKKVLWLNPTKHVHYEMPEAGISYFDQNNYYSFKKRLLNILNMPQMKYLNMTRNRSTYICNYDYRNPPHEIIRAAVLSVLNKPVNKKIYE